MATLHEKIQFILKNSVQSQAITAKDGEEAAYKNLIEKGQTAIEAAYDELSHEVQYGFSWQQRLPTPTLRPDFEEWIKQEQEKYQAENPDITHSPPLL